MFTLEILLFHQIRCSYCLFKTNRFLRHERVSLLLLLNLLIIQSVLLLWFSWKLRHSFWLTKHFHASTLISLSELRSVYSWLWVDVMSKQVVSIDWASICWINVAHSIGMPCWFSKEGCEGWVREPSGCFIEFVNSVDSVLKWFVHVFCFLNFVSSSGRSTSLLLFRVFFFFSLLSF